jgi:hypothetical protein
LIASARWQAGQGLAGDWNACSGSTAAASVRQEGSTVVAAKHSRSSLFLVFAAVLATTGCQLLVPERLRSQPPPCASWKYAHLMGATKAAVQALAIPERHGFTGAGEPQPTEADPLRIMFFMEGDPPVVSGIGCN